MYYILVVCILKPCILSPDRVNVASLVREVVPVLRVFRDHVDFPEPLEAMDPRLDRIVITEHISIQNIFSLLEIKA